MMSTMAVVCIHAQPELLSRKKFFFEKSLVACNNTKNKSFQIGIRIRNALTCIPYEINHKKLLD